jgi:hypothetical protein
VRTVYVVLSCDTDPDRRGFLPGVPAGTLTWRGMTEGIPALKSLLRDVKDSRGREPVFTWLLRADEQVRSVHGDYGWVARAHGAFLRTLEEGGDELGWHPHFWRRDRDNGPWFQEVADVDWQVNMLHTAHRDFVAALERVPRTVRMGWSYHNNRTYGLLETLRVVIDCSALPGYRTLMGRRARGENLFDWRPTPRTPFRPSREDYRRPARGSEGSFPVLEVPSFVSTSLPWSLVGGVKLALKTWDPRQLWFAARRPTYCINVTARPLYFSPLLAELRQVLRRPGLDPVVFSTQFHADELLPNRSHLYTPGALKANLRALLRACERAGTPVEFVQAGRIAELWPH